MLCIVADVAAIVALVREIDALIDNNAVSTALVSAIDRLSCAVRKAVIDAVAATVASALAMLTCMFCAMAAVCAASTVAASAVAARARLNAVIYDMIPFTICIAKTATVILPRVTIPSITGVKFLARSLMC